MKIYLTILLVFLGTVIADGILLPGLFRAYGSLVEFSFLACLLIVYGDEPMFLMIGVVASLMLELWAGLYLGSVIVAWLIAVAVWQACTRFLNIEPLIRTARLAVTGWIVAVGIGYLLMIVMSVAFVIIEKYLYRASVSWDTLALAVASPAVWFTAGLGLVACVYLLRLPGSRALPPIGKFYI